ncbi:TPA: DNA cross-link repair 1A protein [Trebouxia sp. C0004]
MVDGFNFQNTRCKNYFLTHFHSDHTTGLNRAFSSGVIYCSPITATLLTKDMGMPAERVIPLPVDTPIVIDGVSVTLMDANHCPGACMILFKVPSKVGKPQVILHTGDMRWQPRLAEHPALRACKVELLYMDTTYCLPKHVFPSQNSAIASLVKVMREAHAAERKTLFVVGSYHIGKERAFFGAARAMGFKIWSHTAKKRVMEWCEMPKADMDCLVSKESAAQIHVVFMGQGLQPEALEQRRLKGDYAKIVAFRPTGWSYQKKGLQTRREGNVTIFGIPYSEHSSFAELRDCVKRLRPKRIIPTVNCPDATSARAIVDRFADLMDLSRDKSRLDSYFCRTASAPADALANSAHSSHSALPPEPESPSASSAERSGHGDSTSDLGCKPDLVGRDICRSSQPSLHEAANGAAAYDLRKEDSCGSGPRWKSEDMTLGFHNREGFAEYQSGDADLGTADDQVLPMRAESKLVPEHAHSAPAVLSLSLTLTTNRHGDKAAAELPGTPVSCDDDTAIQPGSWAEELSPRASFGDAADVPFDYDVQGTASRCQQGSEMGLQNASYERQQELETVHRLYKVDSCSESADAVSQSLAQVRHSSSLLDGVDIAEQSRILCQIQQQQLYARQCQTTKKRQMTLGCFVAPKRLR